MERSRPPIPEVVKREVRQRCGFGCVVCGLPLYEYDHLVAWAIVGRHTADNLVLLCDQHHREKTSGLLDAGSVAHASRNPCNLRTGVSTPYRLHYSGNNGEAIVGSNLHEFPSLADGQSTSPLTIDDTPLVLFRLVDGELLLTVQLFDHENRMVVQILDNELVYSLGAWDVTFVGRRITIRGGPRKIFAELLFEPPARVVIERAHMWRNGIQVDVTPDQVLVNSRMCIKKCTMQSHSIGLAFGKVPAHIPTAMYFEVLDRSEFAAHPGTEAVVLRRKDVG